MRAPTRYDYPKEPIGNGNPYWRCSACGRSDPAINGRLSGHLRGCSWRAEMVRAYLARRKARARLISS